MNPTLLPITRQQWLQQAITWQPAPPALQSGMNWPSPFWGERLWDVFQFGYVGICVVSKAIEDALDIFKSWLQAQPGECEDEDELADQYEAWAVANGWEPWQP